MVSVGQRFACSRVADRIGRALARSVRVAPPEMAWQVSGGPAFGNEVATLDLDGRRALLTVEKRRPRSGARDRRSPAGSPEPAVPPLLPRARRASRAVAARRACSPAPRCSRWAPGSGGRAAQQGLVLGALALGMPHGAADTELLRSAAHGDRRRHAALVGGYAALAAAATAVVSRGGPAVDRLVLVGSAAHFAEGELACWRTRPADAAGVAAARARRRHHHRRAARRGRRRPPLPPRSASPARSATCPTGRRGSPAGWRCSGAPAAVRGLAGLALGGAGLLLARGDRRPRPTPRC